ncbi:hypothetical protein H4219_006139 [Mycoemilia scoparia]|uniref:Uncharacterized protein n=1 Tax=Mycoemilia scoparia TaxID=417184 RepID=A0A9W7ZSV3_9FUNG|nr:hypothetical protein H4219_006139 [Mycoemilia scoparia]
MTSVSVPPSKVKEPPARSWASVAAAPPPRPPPHARGGNRLSLKAREARIFKAQPALSVPTVSIPLPRTCHNRFQLVHVYLWDLFGEDYLLHNRSALSSLGKKVTPKAYCITRDTEKISVTFESIEALTIALEKPLIHKEVEYYWSTSEGLTLPLVVCTNDPHLTAP